MAPRLAESTAPLVLLSTTLLLTLLMVADGTLSQVPPDLRVAVFEIKYIAVFDNHSALEFVGECWINGAVDWCNRPFFVREGERVCVTAPEVVVVNSTAFCFAFWQLEGPHPLELTYQGVIVTNRTLCVAAEGKQVWWANYAPCGK